MSGKKIPSEFSDEELLKALEQVKEEKVEQSEYHNDILAFLHFYKIENGDNKVTAKLLRQLYVQWSDDPITANHFGQELNKFITRKSDTYYLINQKSFHLAASSYKFLKQNKKDKIKRPLYRKHFDNFLAHYGITKGRSVWVPGFILFHLYDKWVYKNRTIRTLAEPWFYQFCKLHFNRKRPDGSVYYYQLGQTFFDIMTKEKMLEMIESRNNHAKAHKKRQKRQKKDPKKPREISKFDSQSEPKN